jgi:hypothetical protein
VLAPHALTGIKLDLGRELSLQAMRFYRGRDARDRKLRRRRRLDRSPSPRAGGANDLNAACRAQLGPEAGTRAYRPQADDASIEDPLHDWPEDDR